MLSFYFALRLEARQIAHFLVQLLYFVRKLLPLSAYPEYQAAYCTSRPYRNGGLFIENEANTKAHSHCYGGDRWTHVPQFYNMHLPAFRGKKGGSFRFYLGNGG